MPPAIARIALDSPLDTLFDYRVPDDLPSGAVQPGQLVMVPFGTRTLPGIVIATADRTELPPERVRPLAEVRTQLPPLSAQWIALCAFAADYYQRPLGEVALPALPKNLRAPKATALDRALKRVAALGVQADPTPDNAAALHPEQQLAASAIAGAHAFAPILLHGVTGSGKTEVYLQAAGRVLQRHAAQGSAAQILILIPEINLTPQFEANVRQRFPGLQVATLHSGLAEGERTANWLAAHTGKATIVLGTRLAILASLPRLKLIIVDEEHDPSYKQQEGLRYSARDLAVWRAHQLDIPVVLGSATPSLETWQHAQAGRYQTLTLLQRARQNARLPQVRLVDMEKDKPDDGLTATLVGAIRQRLERGEQSLLYLNRRGYAPVISCDACGWVSHCPRCTAFMVLHKPERRLRCHHCSLEQPIPRACPTCGNVDVQPMGRGTQRIEERLQQLFPAARVMRIDADSTRLKGSAQHAFDAVHRGETDILIGTQMVAKGHDFQNLTLVGVLNPDTALFSHDYRASERLFAQLMQVAGRAGRSAREDGAPESLVLVQTRYPHHPLYAALAMHEYRKFAADLLDERRRAALPPFIYQALLRAEAKSLSIALEFLQDAATCIDPAGITVNEPIPMTMTRVANVERAQLLVESASRPALQAFLKQWMAALRGMKTRARWTLEVDPIDI